MRPTIVRVVLFIALFGSQLGMALAELRSDCAQERDPQLAIKACTQLIRSQPKNAEHYINRGWAHFLADNDKAALADAERAIKLNPKLSEAFRLRGRALLALKEYARAEQAFSTAIKLAPDDPRGYIGRADALSQGERVERLRAEGDYDRAIELDSGNADAWLGRGRVRLTWQGFKDALQDFTRALELRPGDAETLDLRAWSLYHLGRLDEALTGVERALERSDSTAVTASALETRAHIVQGLNRFDEAAADARKALALDSDLAQARSLLTYLEGARIPSVGGSCPATGRVIDPRYAAFEVSVDPGATRVGEPLTIAWSLGEGSHDVSRPAYVVVLLPADVRFEGDGFFALAPMANGPYGMTFGAGRTRAIVPLHTRFSRSAGRLQVLPYAAGPLQIEWAVVGFDGCGEWTAGVAQSEPVAISAGAPQLVLRDEFASQKPQAVTRSLDGRYRALSFNDAFQVVEDATGVVVLQREGIAPAFSPTGRFLTVKAPASESVDVFDLVARRAIGRFASVSTLFWSHGDSFFFAGGQRDGWLQIVRTLHGRRHDPRGALPAEGQTWMQEDEQTVKAASSSADIIAGGGGSSFTHAAESWVLDLSIERGIVALKKVDDDGDDREPPAGDDAADGRHSILARIMDLGRSHPDLAFKVIADGIAAVEPGFGGGPPALLAWNVHGPLHVARADDEDTLETAMRVRPIVRPTGAVLDPGSAVVAIAQASPTRRRSVAPAGLSDTAYASASEAMKAQFGHLPHQLIDGYRSGRDDAEMRAVQAEIVPLYSVNVARFDVDVSSRYDTAAFPDPDPPKPPDEVAELDLTVPGRDLWRFVIGETTYWLTQTVRSGRSGHVFDFSLLSSTRAGERRRHAAVLEAANVHHTARLGLPTGREPLDMFQLGDVRTELGSAFGTMSVVGVSGERYLAVLSRPVARLIVFDLAEWRVSCTVANPLDGTIAVSVIVHTDGRHVTQVNRDGAIHVYACDRDTAVLGGAYVDDELVVMDRYGYFDGSEDAAAYIELALPGLPGRHLLSQFESALRRPGIAAEVLAGKSPDRGPALFAPPVVRITAAGVEAFGQSGLRYVQLYADGRAIRRVEAAGRSVSLQIAEEELSRHRSLSVVAVDSAGLASAPAIVSGRHTGAAPLGRLFALGVGIDQYPNIEGAELKYAVSDARRTVAATAASPLYARGDATVLADADADAAAIRSALNRIVAAAGPEDTIMVSFAGHGVIDDGGQLRLVLTMTSLDDLGATSLAFDDIADILKRASARVVLFLDVCHAGLSDRARVAANDDAVNRLTTAAGAGMVILSASKGRQESQERTSADGGLFSVALDRVLTRDRDRFDNDGNGAVSLDELYRGIKALVVQETAGRQTPWLTRNRTFGDFDLF